MMYKMQRDSLWLQHLVTAIYKGTSGREEYCPTMIVPLTNINVSYINLLLKVFILSADYTHGYTQYY